MNQPIRYWKRDCTDKTKIDDFLEKAKVGYLGLSDGDLPYVVPLNYVWYQNAIYFHGADSGRKCDILNRNSHVCFTVSEQYGTIADPVPASTDTAYMSVMLFGHAARVTDLDEATDALQAMLDKHVPGYYDKPLPKQHVAKYRSSLNSEVAVYRITPEYLSAKENPLAEERKFYPGRQVQQDVAKQQGYEKQ